jgi:L-2,4-diaminobutyrate decarboxylase
VVNWRPAVRDLVAVRDRPTGAWVSITGIDGQRWYRSVAANPLADPALVIDRVTAAL